MNFFLVEISFMTYFHKNIFLNIDFIFFYIKLSNIFLHFPPKIKTQFFIFFYQFYLKKDFTLLKWKLNKIKNIFNKKLT